MERNCPGFSLRADLNSVDDAGLTPALILRTEAQERELRRCAMCDLGYSLFTVCGPDHKEIPRVLPPAGMHLPRPLVVPVEADWAAYMRDQQKSLERADRRLSAMVDAYSSALSESGYLRARLRRIISAPWWVRLSRRALEVL